MAWTKTKVDALFKGVRHNQNALNSICKDGITVSTDGSISWEQCMQDKYHASPVVATNTGYTATNAPETNSVQNTHTLPNGLTFTETVTIISPKDVYLSITAAGPGGRWQPGVAGALPTDEIVTVRVDFDQPFTGQLRLYCDGTESREQFGFFSSNLGEPDTVGSGITYDTVTSYPSGTGFKPGTGWYHTDNSDANGWVQWDHVENLKSFTFQQMNHESSTASYEILLYETDTFFTRVFIKDLDTDVTVFQDHNSITGATYTPQGTVGPCSLVDDISTVDGLTLSTKRVETWGSGSTVDCIATVPGPISGTILSSSITTGAMDDQWNIRKVNVLLETNTLARIDVISYVDEVTPGGAGAPQCDGIFSHLIFGGSYSIELENNQAPIKEVIVTELDGTSTRAVINVLSKQEL